MSRSHGNFSIVEKRSLRHRAIITPVSPLLTRLIHISPSGWTICPLVWNYSRNGNCPLDCTSNAMIYTRGGEPAARGPNVTSMNIW